MFHLHKNELSGLKSHGSLRVKVHPHVQPGDRNPSHELMKYSHEQAVYSTIQKEEM